MEHTEGEWKEVQGTSNFTQIGCEKPRYFKIAQTYGENHKSNAQLIASAPDLLEVCKFVFLESVNSGLSGLNGENLQIVRRKCEQAINKAEGR